jgi:hypothetical protein
VIEISENSLASQFFEVLPLSIPPAVLLFSTSVPCPLSPALHFSLQLGDRITAVDGIAVAGRTNAELVALLAARPHHALLAVIPAPAFPRLDTGTLSAADVGLFAEAFVPGAAILSPVPSCARPTLYPLGAWVPLSLVESSLTSLSFPSVTSSPRSPARLMQTGSTYLRSSTICLLSPRLLPPHAVLPLAVLPLAFLMSSACSLHSLISRPLLVPICLTAASITFSLVQLTTLTGRAVALSLPTIGPHLAVILSRRLRDIVRSAIASRLQLQEPILPLTAIEVQLAAGDASVQVHFLSSTVCYFLLPPFLGPESNGR